MLELRIENPELVTFRLLHRLFYAVDRKKVFGIQLFINACFSWCRKSTSFRENDVRLRSRVDQLPE